MSFIFTIIIYRFHLFTISLVAVELLDRASAFKTQQTKNQLKKNDKILECASVYCFRLKPSN